MLQGLFEKINNLLMQLDHLQNLPRDIQVMLLSPKQTKNHGSLEQSIKVLHQIGPVKKSLSLTLS